MIDIIDIEYVIQPDLINGKLILSVQTRSQNSSVHLEVSDDHLKIGGIDWMLDTLKGMKDALVYQVENDLCVSIE